MDLSKSCTDVSTVVAELSTLLTDAAVFSVVEVRLLMLPLILSMASNISLKPFPKVPTIPESFTSLSEVSGISPGLISPACAANLSFSLAAGSYFVSGSL